MRRVAAHGTHEAGCSNVAADCNTSCMEIKVQHVAEGIRLLVLIRTKCDIENHDVQSRARTKCRESSLQTILNCHEPVSCVKGEGSHSV